MDTVSNQKSGQSEIALFFELWEREVEAIERGFEGYAVTARHAFISQRLQAFGEKNLKELRRLDEKRTAEMDEEQEKRSTDKNRGNRDNDPL